MNKEKWQDLKEKMTLEIEQLGYELVDMEFVHEHGSNFLRFFIYQEEGITAEDCEKVSGHLDPILDDLDPIASSYYLEVSSPDLSRPLKSDRDLKRNIGELVEVKLYQKLDGKKEFVGRLLSFNEKELQLCVGEKEWILPRESIAIVKIYINFEG